MKEKLPEKLMQLFLFTALLLSSPILLGQTTSMPITMLDTPVEQNFNNMGVSATATLPDGFILASGTNYTGGTTATTRRGGTYGAGAFTGTTISGFYNLADGESTTSTERAIGFLSSGSYSSPRSIILRITNNTGTTITSLDLNFNYEKYRSGIREFSMTFYHGSDGSVWTGPLAEGEEIYPPDANNTTVYNPVLVASKTVNLSNLSIANGESYYFRWTYTGNGGSTNAKAIGIDDVSVTAGASAVTVDPTVTTTQILQSDITENTAVSGGDVTSDGGATATKGVVWSTSVNPTVALSTKTTDGTGTGAYVSNISGLNSNTRYYYRAYATNSSGTGYGTEYDFYTLADTPAAPAVDNATTSSLDITINENGNNATTQYAIQVVHNGTTYYVDASGALTASEVWQTAAQWGTKTVIGLQDNETYSFSTKARNGATVETALSPVTEGTTLSATAPILTLVNSDLEFGSICTNASATGSFTFNGTNLSGADIAVSSLTGYTYSLTQDGTYNSTIIVENYNGGDITVWVQFNPSAVQAYDGEISLAAPGDASLNVPVTGNGINTASTVVTGVSSGITSVSATVAGEVSAQGCAVVTAFGLEYSTTNGFADGTGTQVSGTGTETSFTANLISLSPNTTYFYKAYAAYGGGVAYGSQQAFTTSAIGTPVTTDATGVAANSFIANWTAVEGAVNYRLDVSTSPTFTTENYATDLFISEYVEGSSLNKYLEIYNGTGETVDLSDYAVRLYSNGNSSYNAEELLSGTLAHGSTLVLKNASTVLYSGTAISSATINFTGDDAVALYKISTDSFVDIFGRIGEDPGASWSAAGTHTTSESTLRRKATVMGGVTNNPDDGFPTLATEWNQYGQNTVNGLGSHTFNGSAVGSFVPGYENLSVGNVTSFEVTGLEELTTYYYRVRAESTNSTSLNSNVTEVMTKISAVTWNGTEWLPSTYPDGTPVVKDNTVDAIIEGDFTTATDETFTPKDIIINSGIFTVAAGTTFTVQNAIVNNASATNFVVENEGSLIQVNDVNNIGDITVHRYSNELFRLDYTLWSAPVTGQNLFSFSPGTQLSRFYVYGYDAGNDSTEFLSVSADDNYAHNNNTPDFLPGKGYLIRMPNELTEQMTGYPENSADYSSGATPSVFEGQFAGVPNNGNVTVALPVNGGYSIVGNPYPSPILVEEFFTNNAANLEPGFGLFFWRKKNNADATSYAILSMDSYVANDGGVESADNPDEYSYGGQQWESYYQTTADSLWTISQGQGFFVRTISGAAPITFNNSMRRAPQPGQPFFRNGQDTPSEKSKLWFNLTAQGQGFSQASVVYNPAATLGIDAGRDAKMFGNSGNTALFTYAGEEKLAIQSRPRFDAADVVPMGYRVNNAGTYTISLHRMEGIFETGQEVYLRDNLLNLVHNIKQGDYTFTTEAGTIANRFDIIYSNEALGTNDNIIDANTVVVYKQDNILKVDTGKEDMQSVTIYDLRGRTLYTATGINTSQHSVPGLQVQQQVLLVQIATTKGLVTKKVIY